MPNAFNFTVSSRFTIPYKSFMLLSATVIKVMKNCLIEQGKTIQRFPTILTFATVICLKCKKQSHDHSHDDSLLVWVTRTKLFKQCFEVSL